MSVIDTLAAELLANHGKDRYPTVELSALKLTEELGELVGSILKGHGPDKKKKELADVALCLHILAMKMGYDIEEVVLDVVISDNRTIENGLLPDSPY